MYYDEDAPYRDEEENIHTDTSEISVLDQARIEDLDVGDKMEAESEHFTVARGAQSYAIHCDRGIKKGQFYKDSAEQVIEFLLDN